jgi:hypothetical protein
MIYSRVSFRTVETHDACKGREMRS